MPLTGSVGRRSASRALCGFRAADRSTSTGVRAVLPSVSVKSVVSRVEDLSVSTMLAGPSCVEVQRLAAWPAHYMSAAVRGEL